MIFSVIWLRKKLYCTLFGLVSDVMTPEIHDPETWEKEHLQGGHQKTSSKWGEITPLIRVNKKQLANYKVIHRG